MFPRHFFPSRAFAPRYFAGLRIAPRPTSARLLLRRSTSQGDQLLRLHRGQDLTLRAEFVPPESVAGWSIAFELQDAPGGAPVLEKSTADGISATDLGRGILAIQLARDDTAELTPSRSLPAGKGYVWNVQRTDLGQHALLAQGSLVLLEGGAS